MLWWTEIAKENISFILLTIYKMNCESHSECGWVERQTHGFVKQKGP